MNLKNYAYLMRLHKPIGILLLLWPTWWALWLAGDGHPDRSIVIIFTLGVILMRSAGCIINDIADRHFDKFVERTKQRPITSGKVSVREAIILFVILLLSAFILTLFLNRFTLFLAFIGAILAMGYPYLKRITYLPQLGLGVAFAWGVPMAFAAENHAFTLAAGYVFLAALIWPIIYDTMYAMVDRADDLKIGVKSSAILFGKQDRLIIAILQMSFLWILASAGYFFALSWFYFVALVIAGVLFCYQQWLIRQREPKACFNAFLNNNWVGFIIFVGILLS
jgi:4-hydroxybenzoate polyprenyltransferase